MPETAILVRSLRGRRRPFGHPTFEQSTQQSVVQNK
jgi:hypothetical protein